MPSRLKRIPFSNSICTEIFYAVAGRGPSSTSISTMPDGTGFLLRAFPSPWLFRYEM